MVPEAEWMQLRSGILQNEGRCGQLSFNPPGVHAFCHVIYSPSHPSQTVISHLLTLGPAIRLALDNGVWTEMTVCQPQA